VYALDAVSLSLKNKREGAEGRKQTEDTKRGRGRQAAGAGPGRARNNQTKSARTNKPKTNKINHTPMSPYGR
jgi:hypothetical protein